MLRTPCQGGGFTRLRMFFLADSAYRNRGVLDGRRGRCTGATRGRPPAGPPAGPGGPRPGGGCATPGAVATIVAGRGADDPRLADYARPPRLNPRKRPEPPHG